jgi:hypothetical protein
MFLRTRAADSGGRRGGYRVIPSQRWLRRVAVVGTALMAAGLIQVVAPPSANAASCGSRSTRLVGYNQYEPSPLWVEGVSAVITDRGGYVLCTTENSIKNFSSSWTMVFDEALGWAQSGTMYRWGYGSCVKLWAQQARTGVNDWVESFAGGCSAVGSARRYWQEFVFVNGSYRIRSRVDSTIIMTSSFSPITEWDAPYEVAFMAETSYEASNVPGVPSSKQNFTSMQVQRWSDNAWVTTCGNTGLTGWSGSVRYDFDRPSCNNVRTWTK